MKIIIPMSGIGKRFLDAGYQDPKPIIQVDGKPMIEHLVSLFSKDDDFIFICNNDHLKNTNIRQVLEGLDVNKRILGIGPHKLGPVYAVLPAFSEFSDDEPVIVSYCDFGFSWDYEEFKKLASGYDAAVTSYTGFHPHLLGNDLYASMRTENSRMLECREKYCFTENKMDCNHQSGMFYFSKGSIIKKFFPMALEMNLAVNNEFYISSVTELMAKSGLNIFVYPLPHFLQWGTPEHFENYKSWSAHFARQSGNPLQNSAVSMQSSKAPDLSDSRESLYWENFFRQCKWHPYGKGGKPIKGILLDLDNTLYDYTACDIYAREKLCEKISEDLQINKAAVISAYESARVSIKNILGTTASSHSRLLYIQKTLEALKQENYAERCLHYYDYFYDQFFGRMKLLPGVKEFLSFAKENGLKTCIVTDMTAVRQIQKMKTLGITSYIDFLVTSEETGIDKPSLQIIKAALDKMGLESNEVLFIGDDEKDRIGSEKMKIRFIKAGHDAFSRQPFHKMLQNQGSDENHKIGAAV